MELISGEAGVLRTALGVVLGMEGIDARVRLYLWSGGVEDAVLPTMNGAAIPAGTQVIVTFLSDRTASGMVLGTVERAVVAADCAAGVCGAAPGAVAGDQGAVYGARCVADDLRRICLRRRPARGCRCSPARS